MRIAIGCDHGGFEQKASLVSFLISLGHEVVDCGAYSAESVDYPDYATSVARAVAAGEVTYGILICGTGLGMCLAANKVHGVRAVAVQTPLFARLARQHNNANVLCLSGRFVSSSDNMRLISVFTTTDFDDGRHAKRVAKIMEEEQ